MFRSRKLHQRRSWKLLFSHQGISQSAVWTPLEKQLELRGPISSQGAPIPVFLRKHIANCDFPGGSWPPVPHYGSALEYYSKACLKPPFKKKSINWFSRRFLLNAGQKYCRILQKSILQYFRLSLSYHLSLRPLFCQFLRGHLKQVLLYTRCKMFLHEMHCLWFRTAKLTAVDNIIRFQNYFLIFQVFFSSCKYGNVITFYGSC